jgi:NADH oxidase (H2O2-forming)
MKVIIIGASSAGTTCALQLRKIDKELEITIIEKTNHLEYSPCSLPYILSEEIENRDDIFLFSKEDYEQKNIKLMLGTEVKSIDKENKTVETSKNEKINYDKLVIATGSYAFVPPIKGINDVEYFTFKTIDDFEKIKPKIEKGKKAAIIGGGLIGVEIADSLKDKEMGVTLIEAKDCILAGLFDSDMAENITEKMQKKDIRVITSAKISEIKKQKISLEQEDIDYDILIACTGVRANTKLAKNSGLETGFGIKVDKQMKTSDDNIYACGDCVESISMITKKEMPSQLGTTAVRQAKVVAKNIAGIKEEFPFVLNTTISKFANNYFGCAGINKERAEKNNIKTISASFTGLSKAEYYPRGKELTVKIISDMKGKIIGAQLLGEEGIAGRVDALSFAMQKEMTLKELSEGETCYNPASAPIYDPMTLAAEICLRKLESLNKKGGK